MRLRATISVEYEANPAHYDTTDPMEAAAIDHAGLQDSPVALVALCEQCAYHVTVEPVEAS